MEKIKELYKELQSRVHYLESQKETEEIKWRIREVTLAIVRVQQIILANLSDIQSEDDAVQFANWIMQEEWVQYRFDGEVSWRRYVSLFKDEYKTSAELYEIFKQKKIKK